MLHRPLKIALYACAGVAVTAGVVACAAQDRLSGGGPSLAGYGLHYMSDSESAKLAYGRENSDSVGLMLECARGSGHVEISDVGRKGSDALSLISGGKRSDFRGSVEAGSGPSPVVYTTARTSSPALQGFRKTGKIEVRTAAARYTVVANDEQKPMVERFFDACGTV